MKALFSVIIHISHVEKLTRAVEIALLHLILTHLSD